MLAKAVLFGAPFVFVGLVCLMTFPLIFCVKNYINKVVDVTLDVYLGLVISLSKQKNMVEGVDFVYANR